MAFSRVALGALLAMLASPAQTEGVKWVPLKSPGPIKLKPEPSPVRTPAAPTISRVAGTPEAAPPQTAVSPAAPSSVTGRLDLTCFGGGTANKFTAVRTFGSSHVSGSVGTVPFSGSGYGSGTAYGTRQQAFGDQVDVRLFGGDDRIRMPRTMLPGIRGGKDGWFKLRNVVADTRSVRASAAVNALNNPKVFIDRVTGTISISGKSGDYAGQCEVIDAAAAPKF